MFRNMLQLKHLDVFELDATQTTQKIVVNVMVNCLSSENVDDKL